MTAQFTVSVYTNGKLGVSVIETLDWNEVDNFEDRIKNLVQGPKVEVEILEYER
jgi:hypothetical protein